MHKRIAVDLAKSVYQVAESVRVGHVSQRKRLNRAACAQYMQEQTKPVEWVMEACGTAHYWEGLPSEESDISLTLEEISSQTSFVSGNSFASQFAGTYKCFRSVDNRGSIIRCA